MSVRFHVSSVTPLQEGHSVGLGTNDTLFILHLCYIQNAGIVSRTVSFTMCALVIPVSDCFLILVCETYTSYYRGDQVLLFPAICEAYAASDYIVVINERKFVQLD